MRTFIVSLFLALIVTVSASAKTGGVEGAEKFSPSPDTGDIAGSPVGGTEVSPALDSIESDMNDSSTGVASSTSKSIPLDDEHVPGPHGPKGVPIEETYQTREGMERATKMVLSGELTVHEDGLAPPKKLNRESKSKKTASIGTVRVVREKRHDHGPLWSCLTWLKSLINGHEKRIVALEESGQSASESDELKKAIDEAKKAANDAKASADAAAGSAKASGEYAANAELAAGQVASGVSLAKTLSVFAVVLGLVVGAWCFRHYLNGRHYVCTMCGHVRHGAYACQVEGCFCCREFREEPDEVMEVDVDG